MALSSILPSFSSIPLTSDRKTLGAAIAFSASIALAVSWNARRRSNDSDVSRLRQPSGAHWLWGHDYVAWATLDFGWYKKNVAEDGLGLVYAMKGALFHPDIVVVVDPGALNYMYTKRAYHYNKDPVFRSLFERVLGRGLVWATGQTHKRQRAMVAPFLSHQRIRMADETLQALVFRMVAKFDASLPSGGSSTVDMIPWISGIALDVVGSLCFNHDFGCGESEDAQLIFATMENQARLGMTFPGFVAPLVLRAFPWLSKWMFSLTAAQEMIKLAVREHVATALLAKRGNDEAHAEHNFDLLSGLMAKTDMNDEAQVDELMDQIVTILIAGNETAAKTIPMVLIELARNPGIQSALREELTSFEGSRSDGRPTYDEYLGNQQLPLLDAVVIEGTRLYPNAERMAKQADEDDIIPLRFPIQTNDGQTLSSIRVRKGQVFYFELAPINTNPQVWGPTGDKFDPYRWIKPGGVPPVSELTGGINGIASFAEGARLCVGYRLALFEMKVIVAELIKRFEFAEVEGVNIRTTWAGLLHPVVEGQLQKGAQAPLVVRRLG